VKAKDAQNCIPEIGSLLGPHFCAYQYKSLMYFMSHHQIQQSCGGSCRR
jgi:hypothetical protein